MIRARHLPAESPGEEDRVRLQMGGQEFALLESVPQRLREVLIDPDAVPKVIERLFPRAHDDEAEDAEYRKLLGSSLFNERLEGLTRYATLMSSARPMRRAEGRELTLSSAEVDLVLHVVNDLRLMVGTELEVADNEWFKGRPKSPEDLLRMHLLATLSAVQEILLVALSGGEGRAGPGASELPDRLD